MVVKIDGGKRGYVDLEHHVARDVRQQTLVERVQPLKNNHRIVLELELIALELAFAGLEVEAGQCDLFPLKQVSQLLAEERQVDRLDVLEIPITVLVLRCVFAVDEVVIHREHNRAHAVDKHLDSETFTEGRLT